MTTDTASRFKEQGNVFFAKKDYLNAISAFTKAIELDGTNAILFANRAACYSGLKRYQQSFDDAKKSTALDPGYAKAWYRLGSAQDASGNYPESIESYQQALSLVSRTEANSSQRRQIKTAIDEVIAKVMNPETMSLDVIIALARAHDIPVPKPHLPENRDVIAKAIFNDPIFTTTPAVRLLFIPQSQTQPLKQVELKSGPDFRKEVCRLLNCDLSDSVLLHSEDHMAYAQGKPYGVGVGRIHASWEAFMDDSAVAKRPLNKRASKLLCRPQTFGPILVMKTTFIKSQPDIFGRAEDILCFERITEGDLKSKNFRKLRKEWEETKYQSVHDTIQSLGDSVTVLSL